MIPLRIPGQEARLTPGAHNELIEAIIEEFGPRFAPGAEVLYVGDTGSKMVHFDMGLLSGTLALLSIHTVSSQTWSSITVR